MNRTGPVVVAAVALVLVAACGASTGSGGTAASSSGAGPATSAPGSSATPTATTTPSTVPPAPTQGARVLSSRVAYPWGWPGPMSSDTAVRHTAKVPPVPELVQIRVGEHPADSTAGGGYDRISFTFTHAFPSSDFWYSDTLLTVAAGTVVPRRPGTTWLAVSFTVAQAHTGTGASSITSQPVPPVGGQRIVGFVQAGDFEGGVNYGIAVARPDGSGARIPVRVVEVQTVSATGQHLYTVAFDVPLMF